MNALLQPVVLRLLIYILSPLIGLVPASFAGAVSLDTAHGILAVNFPAMVTAGLSAVAVTGGVFAKWGTK